MTSSTRLCTLRFPPCVSFTCWISLKKIHSLKTTKAFHGNARRLFRGEPFVILAYTRWRSHPDGLGHQSQSLYRIYRSDLPAFCTCIYRLEAVCSSWTPAADMGMIRHENYTISLGFARAEPYPMSTSQLRELDVQASPGTLNPTCNTFRDWMPENQSCFSENTIVTYTVKLRKYGRDISLLDTVHTRARYLLKLLYKLLTKNYFR